MEQQKNIAYSRKSHDNDLPQSAISIPEPFTSHRLEIIPFDSGLTMFMTEMTLSQPMTIPYTVETGNSFALYFLISGEVSCRFPHLKNSSSNYDSLSCAYHNMPDGDGVAHFGAREPIRSVSINFDEQAIHQLLGDNIALLPGKDKMLKEGGAYFNIARSLLPSMTLSAHRALCCPTGTQHNRLFLESKMLELVTLYLLDAQRLNRRSNGPMTGSISLAVRDKLQAAREILMAECAAPPTITALSRRIGLNECTLKYAFKRQFETTIYGFVQKERMRKAKALIEGGMTVSQAASQVGYVNFSHFAKAFRKIYGPSPSKLRC